ncbi:MAG: GerMN domain-containing protein [Acidimicrobiales bacterium]
MKRLRRLSVLLVGAMLLSGCSLIPTSSKPVVIPSSQVELNLLNRTIPGTNNGRVRFITQPVYLVDATGHLAPQSRIVTAPAQLTSVLGQLIVGPTSIEASAGYASDLPNSLIVLQASIRGKVAYIDVSESLSTVGREEEALAVGQLVFTAYYAGATDGIEISVAGVSQLSMLPNGSFTKLVTAKECQTLLEP